VIAARIKWHYQFDRFVMEIVFHFYIGERCLKKEKIFRRISFWKMGYRSTAVDL